MYSFILKYVQYLTRSVEMVPRASLIVLATIADVEAITQRFGRRHENADGTVVAIDWDAVRISMPCIAYMGRKGSARG